MKKRVRACGIVIDKNKVLLIYRKVNDKEYYVFPGGGVEDSESIEKAVIREVKEESSINIKVRRLLHHFENKNNDQYFYLCSYVSGKPKIEEGIGKSCEKDHMPYWLEIDKLKDMIVLPLEVRDLVMSI